MLALAMSLRVMQITWDKLTVRGTDLLVMLAIAEAANEYASGCISYRLIGLRAGLEATTVKRAVKRLKEADWLLVGKYTCVGLPACYQINVAKMEGMG